MVVSGDCVYAARNITGHNNDGVYVPLANGVGSIWEQLKTIDRINNEIGGDISPLDHPARCRPLVEDCRSSRRSTASASCARPRAARRFPGESRPWRRAG